MRLLITGASGLVGGNLALAAATAGHEVFATYGRHPVTVPGCHMLSLDLSDDRQIAAALEEAEPDGVVHAAAMADPDACEADQASAWRVNVEATQRLASGCARADARLVYISTDLVFDGHTGWYAEEDTPNPLSFYGRTKLEGERRVLEAHPGACCTRTALVYGWSIRTEKPSASEWVLDALRTGRAVRLFADQYRTPVLANNLCQAILEILEEDVRGVLHLGGLQRLSRYEFGLALAGVYGLDPTPLVPVLQDTVALRAARPRDCSLDTGRARATLAMPLLDIPAGLARLKELEEKGYVSWLRGGKVF